MGYHVPRYKTSTTLWPTEYMMGRNKSHDPEFYKNDGFEKSVNTLISEVERCAQLGLPYLVTHLGSHLGTGEEAGIKKLVEGLTTAGQTKIDVIILSVDSENKKISLGIKQLEENPWKNVKDKYEVGQTFDSNISTILKNGY